VILGREEESLVSRLKAEREKVYKLMFSELQGVSYTCMSCWSGVCKRPFSVRGQVDTGTIESRKIVLRPLSRSWPIIVGRLKKIIGG